MSLADAIRTGWSESGRFRPIHRIPTITGEGLLLGAGTRLLRMRKMRDGRSRLAIDEQGDRLIALLLSANALRSVGSVRAIRKASDCWAEGERCLAEIHLALAGFRELDERDTYRLFLADSLLAAGFAPGELLKALDVSPGATGIGRTQNELRVPGGNGRASGEWTVGGGGSSVVGIAARRNSKATKEPNGDPDKFFSTLEPRVRALAQRLNIDETWLLGLAAYESGWLGQHNRSRNDPFGETKGGGADLHYPSMDAAVAAWERNHGAAVRGASSAEDFARRLMERGYNSANPDWLSQMIDTIHSVQRRLPKWAVRNNGI